MLKPSILFSVFLGIFSFSAYADEPALDEEEICTTDFKKCQAKWLDFYTGFHNDEREFREHGGTKDTGKCEEHEGVLQSSRNLSYGEMNKKQLEAYARDTASVTFQSFDPDQYKAEAKKLIEKDEEEQGMSLPELHSQN